MQGGHHDSSGGSGKHCRNPLKPVARVGVASGKDGDLNYCHHSRCPREPSEQQEARAPVAAKAWGGGKKGWDLLEHGMGWDGMGWDWMRSDAMGWVGLGWVVVTGWAGLQWAGLGWIRLGWAKLG